MKRRSNWGGILLAALALSIIILMLVGILLQRGRTGLFQSSHYRDSVRALQAARGGVNHVMTLLEENAAYSSDLSIALEDAEYSITFDPGNPNFSVNNLSSASPSTQTNMFGEEVPPRSADIVVTARSGRVERRVHVILSNGFSAFRSASAVGRVILTGDVKVDGIKSLTPPPGQTEPAPAPGGVLSKFESTNASEPSIEWIESGGTFELSELSRLEASAPSGGAAFSSNLESLFPDRAIEDGASDVIPDIDVDAYVAGGMASPPLAGGSTLAGYVYVGDSRSRSGNVTVNGTLSLTEGTLYVDGDLTVNVNIEGTGSVFVSGDINVVGGNTLVMTDRPAGVALLAGGDVSLQGINAAGALQNLASLYGFEPATDRLFSLLTGYQGSVGFSWVALGKHDGPWVPDPPASAPPPDNLRPLGPAPIEEWVNPIAGPNGGHALAFSNAATTRVVLSLKETYPAYTSDPQALKVVKALEDLQYFFRSNKHYVKHDGTSLINQAGTRFFDLEDDYQLTEGGVPIAPNEFTPNALDLLPPMDLLVTDDSSTMLDEDWDDRGAPDYLRTHDAIFALLGNNADLQNRRRDAFFEANNPLDANWLGDSYFQGMVYARGDVSAETNFRVVGALISLGNISLSNGSWLTLNEEYSDLVGQVLPIGLVFYEEL